MPRAPQQTVIRRQLDAKLGSMRLGLGKIQSPAKGWVRAIRKALGMTHSQAAQRVGIARNSLLEMEQREAAGTITLETLRRLAAGLDCDLVYCLVPRTSLAQTVEQQAFAHAQRLMRAVAHSMALEAQGVDAAEREAQIRDLVDKLVRDTDSRIWDEL